MTDHANELRRYSRKIGQPAGDVPSVMLAAADEIERLAAKLEAAERERDALRADKATLQQMTYSLKDRLEVADRSLDRCRSGRNEAELLAKLEEEKTHYENTYKKLLKERKITSSMVHNIMQMSSELREIESQKPVGKFIQRPSNGIWEQDVCGDNPEARPLYALPGAKVGEPAPSVPEAKP